MSGTLFVPDLDFIAVGIRDEDIRLSWNELALSHDTAARCLRLFRGRTHVVRTDETKPEMRNPARFAGFPRTFLEDDHIMGSRRLGLDRLRVAIQLADPEELTIELVRALRVSGGEREMREPVCSNHSSPFRHARNRGVLESPHSWQLLPPKSTERRPVFGTYYVPTSPE